MADTPFTRRAVLRAIPTFTAAAVVPVSAGAASATLTRAERIEETAMERLFRCRADYMAAAKAAFPQVNDWRASVNEDLDGGQPFVFMLAGHHRT